MEFLIFHVNGIGDRLMALPAIQALASRFPGEVSILGTAKDHDRFYRGLPLKAVYEEMRVVSNGWSFDPDKIARIVARHQVFISLNTWHSILVEDLLGKIIGVDTSGYFPNFGRFYRADRSLHASDDYFRFAKIVDSSLWIEDSMRSPGLSVEDKKIAESIVGSFSKNGILVVHTETKREKMWPMQFFRSVLEVFLGDHPEYVVIVLDREDRGLAKMRFGSRVFSCSGASLGVAMAIIARATLFLGIDSCMLHAADLFRVPGVGLFGHTSARRYGFRFSRHHHFSSREPIEESMLDQVLVGLTSLLQERRYVRQSDNLILDAM
jgi:ADP-heptose:LPS heptosyltransferase